MHVGPDFILVNISVKFRGDVRATAIEAAITRLDRDLKKGFPEIKRVFVEAEGLKQTPLESPPSGGDLQK
jgi:divalent metal cation (Fe/Co/Zn/Cd) transporter